jgi:hypothetical protein
MSAPFDPQGLLSDQAGYAVALVLGLGFGFFLERAGFGSARKLTAQFYLYDMSVLKVMFTAIVTAMLGLAALSAIGWLDLGEIYLVPTYLVPQLVGGLLLGVGFVVGGYCPGTSVVGFATGRVDAFVYALGILSGLAAFAAMQPSIEGFTKSTALGELTFPELFGVPFWLLAIPVAAMAYGAFKGATALERRYARLRPSR